MRGLPRDGGGSAQRRHGDACDADHPRPEIDPEHRADLADEQRLRAEQLAAALDEPRGLGGRLDVLDEPAVDALVVQIADDVATVRRILAA